MAKYNLLFRKLGDGYSFFRFYTPDPGGADPYGEPTLVEVMADDQSFGGTDPTGAEIAIERELLDDEVSQETGPIQRLVIGESATFKIVIPAGRIENLAILAGKTPTDVATVNASDLPGSFDGSGILIGGEIELDFFALVHEVCNSVSPNLKEYLYAPNCQSAEGFGWGFKKNEVRKGELTINIFPARQDAFEAAGACAARHALFQVIYEYTA